VCNVFLLCLARPAFGQEHAASANNEVRRSRTKNGQPSAAEFTRDANLSSKNDAQADPVSESQESRIRRRVLAIMNGPRAGMLLVGCFHEAIGTAPGPMHAR
jgi:hypothetical protein